MALTQLTWTDIAEFVSEIHAKEGARPNASFYRVLANHALNIVSERTELVDASWDNAAQGELTLTDYYALLPIDCLFVRSVEWDGDDNRLHRTTKDILDETETGWRSRSSDPTAFFTDKRYLYLNSVPSGATGKLVVRGVGSLPSFSDAEGAENPLASLPGRFQLSVAYYILSQLPAKVQPIEVEGRIIGLDKSEIERQQKYEALWQTELAEMERVLSHRGETIFVY